MNAAPVTMSTLSMESDCTKNAYTVSDGFESYYENQPQEIPMVSPQQKEQLDKTLDAIQQGVEYVEQEGGFIFIGSFLIGTGIVHVLSAMYAVFLAYQCNMETNWLEIAIGVVFPYFYVPYAYYAKQCSSEILIPILMDVFGAVGGIFGSFFSSIPALVALVISGFSMYYLRRIDKHLAPPQQMQQA
jgi:hypothetical protein